MQTIAPILGPLTEDGHFPDARFKTFRSTTGIHGLACVTGSRLELLAVISPTGTKGCFREFIKQCKGAYSEIRFWCLMNPALATVLKRYSFTEGHDMDQYGQMQDVWDWTKAARDHTDPNTDLNW